MQTSLIMVGFGLLLFVGGALIILGVNPIFPWIIFFLLVIGYAATYKRSGSSQPVIRWNYRSGKLARKLTKSEILGFAVILIIALGLFWLIVKFGLE